jgi:hypothetical protein
MSANSIAAVGGAKLNRGKVDCGSGKSGSPERFKFEVPVKPRVNIFMGRRL